MLFYSVEMFKVIHSTFYTVNELCITNILRTKNQNKKQNTTVKI